MQRLHGVVFMILHSLVEKSGKDILIESMFVEKCPVTGGALTLPDRTFFICFCIRVCFILQKAFGGHALGLS